MTCTECGRERDPVQGVRIQGAFICGPCYGATSTPTRPGEVSLALFEKHVLPGIKAWLRSPLP